MEQTHQRDGMFVISVVVSMMAVLVAVTGVGFGIKATEDAGSVSTGAASSLAAAASPEARPSRSRSISPPPAPGSSAAGPERRADGEPSVREWRRPARAKVRQRDPSDGSEERTTEWQ